MRRLIRTVMTLLTIMLMAVFCQGCGQTGGRQEAKEDIDVTENAEETKEDDQSAKEAAGASDEASPAADEDNGQQDEASYKGPLKLVIENKSHEEYKEPDSYNVLMSGSYAKAYLADECKVAYPELEKSLEAFNKQQEEEYLKTYEEYLNEAKSWYEEAEDKESFAQYSLEKKIDITRADDVFLCIRVNESDYMGGAHGSYGSGGYNFDSVSGKELNLKDVIPDIEALRTVVKDKIVEKYSDSILLDSLDESIPEYLTGEADQGCSWFITPDGVDIYFGIYQLGAYASGAQTVSITYDEHPELFFDGFRKQEDNYVEKVSIWDTITTDINGDGTKDTLMIEPETDDYDWVNSLYITVNGEKNTMEVYGYDTTPYLVHVGGKTYIYVHMTMENDYSTTRAFRVNGNKVEMIGEYGGYITDNLPVADYESDWITTWEAPFTSPSDIYIGDIIQIFSTHTGIAKAYINDNGELIKPEDYYYAMKSDDYNMTSKKDLTADMVDKESLEVASEKVTVPAKTKFSVYGTKGEDIVDLIDEKGNIYRFSIKTDDWPQTIDGTDIEELFDGIMFAG